MKIALLTKYSNLAASTRYRFDQYEPYLKKEGFELNLDYFSHHKKKILSLNDKGQAIYADIYSDKIDNYIGGHQFWFCLPNWEQYLKDILDKLYNQIPVEPSPLSPRVVESNDSTNSTINGDKSGDTS